MSKELLIVTSHYKENLDWLVNQNIYDYKIYTKNRAGCMAYPQDKLYDCINKGFDASSYLTYLVDNYGKYPQYVAFVHGHAYSQHQTDHILNLIKRAKFIDYESLNRRDWRNIFNNKSEGPDINNWNWVKKYYNELNFSQPKPKCLEFTAAAQFVISRNLLMNNSYQDYLNMLNWLIRTDVEDLITSRVFEHLWHYIFTHKEIEEL